MRQAIKITHPLDAHMSSDWNAEQQVKQQCSLLADHTGTDCSQVTLQSATEQSELTVLSWLSLAEVTVEA